MQKPHLKPFYQMYKRDDEPAIYIGVGPDKVVIDEPTPEMEAFIRDLDGST